MSGHKHAEKCQGGVLVAAGYMYNERFGFSSHLTKTWILLMFKNATE
jgi:hypothetical protein